MKCDLCGSNKAKNISVTGIRHKHLTASKNQKKVTATIFFHAVDDRETTIRLCGNCQKHVLTGIVTGENYE